MKNIFLHITSALTIISMIATMLCIPSIGMTNADYEMSSALNEATTESTATIKSEPMQSTFLSFIDTMEEIEEEEEEEEEEIDSGNPSVGYTTCIFFVAISKLYEAQPSPGQTITSSIAIYLLFESLLI